MKTLLALAACATALGLARPALAQDYTPAHLAAARDMIAAANDSSNFYQAFEMGLRRSLPALGNDSTVVLTAINTWRTKYMRWADLEPQYERMYASFYTESEMRDIATFLRSPAGRKMVANVPQLLARSAELGQRIVQEHGAELQMSVMEAVQGPTADPKKQN